VKYEFCICQLRYFLKDVFQNGSTLRAVCYQYLLMYADVLSI